MKSDPRCAPCLLNRTLYEAGLSTRDPSLIFKVMESGLGYLDKHFEEGVNATNISTGIHRRAYAILGDDDPYKEIKAQSNAIAKKLMPAVRKRVAEAPEGDRFRLAVLASIVGNNFDFGLQEHQIEIGDSNGSLRMRWSGACRWTTPTPSWGWQGRPGRLSYG